MWIVKKLVIRESMKQMCTERETKTEIECHGRKQRDTERWSTERERLSDINRQRENSFGTSPPA